MSTQATRLQQLSQERARFTAAYKANQITQAQYDSAMAFNRQQFASAGAPLPPPAAANAPKSTSISPTSPLPAEVGTAQYNRQGSYVAQGQILSQKTVPVTTHSPETPLVKTLVGYRTETVLGPVVSNQPKPSALELANKQAEIRSRYLIGSSTRQGTSGIAPSMAQITSGLSAADKAVFQQQRVEKQVKAVSNLGLFLGVGVAAPILGPVVALEAAGLGLGITQGVKTASTAIKGEDIRGSLLTPSEALEAAATGVIFSGVSKGVMLGITKFAPITIAEKVSGQGIKSTFARASVNAMIGGTASYGLSGGKPEAFLTGAAFGGVFSLGGEALGAGAAKINAKYDLAPRVFGVKAQELIAVSEVEKQVLVGKDIQINRLTQLQTEPVKLSYKEANVYKTLLGEYSKPRILLGGTEKVAIISEGQRAFGFRTAEANRSAQPVIEALKGSPYTMKELRLGKLSKFVETPSADLAIQKTELLTGFKRVKGRNPIPAIKATKLIKTLKEPIVPQEKMILREFTGIQMTAKLGNGKYSKFEDLLQPTSKAMKFENKPLKEAMKPLGGSIGSKKSVAEVSGETRTAKGKVNAVTMQKEAVKAILLPKNIVKVGNIPSRATFGGSMIAPNIEDEETTFLTFPKANIKTELGIIPSQIQPLTINKPSVSSINIVKEATKFTSPSNIEVPNVRKRLRDDVIRVIKPNQDNLLTPVVVPLFKPIVSFGQGSNQIFRVAQDTGYKLTDVQKQKGFTDVITPQITGFRPKVTFPMLGLGGGEGGFGAGALFGGKWSKKKYKLKSYQQMLKTFGLGGTAKGLGNVDKSLKAFDRQTKRFEKGLKPKPSKSKVRKRKR